MSALLTTPCERKQQQIVQTQSLNSHQGVFAGNPSWFLRFTIQLHLQVVFVKCLMVKRWERGKNARNASSGRAAFPHLLMLPSAPWHWLHHPNFPNYRRNHQSHHGRLQCLFSKFREVQETYANIETSTYANIETYAKIETYANIETWTYSNIETYTNIETYANIETYNMNMIYVLKKCKSIYDIG